VPCELKLGPERHALVDLGSLARLAILAVPGSRGSFREQAEELLAQVRCIVGRQAQGLTPTALMVFLRDGRDEPVCREIVRSCFGEEEPVTTTVEQPPCCGSALGIELWALGGPGVGLVRPGPGVLVVENDGIRWVHCGGIRAEGTLTDPYQESAGVFDRMRRGLALAGMGMDRVVRTWIYVNQITEEEGGLQRYQELNRARTDFYRNIRFAGGRGPDGVGRTAYPASTGIGTGGERITMACLAMDSRRPDVFLLPLENPVQTPAFDYQPVYSLQSPKFSRAMAVVQGHFVSTLVSGTASIVDSRTAHVGDVVRQTEQTLENIERLIGPENYARHGLPGAGATLKDVAKLRVYVKRVRDYEACRRVVERALPRVPALYLHADVCRPDLLVEIEAVAFSPLQTAV
jgi:enamine deaminase RidA (YjgF/YER057c/UK114 family)